MTSEKVHTESPKTCCTARNVLWYLVFVGFAVNYMLRINLNIAIVSMVQKRTNVVAKAQCETQNLIFNRSLSNSTAYPSSQQTSLLTTAFSTTTGKPVDNNLTHPDYIHFTIKQAKAKNSNGDDVDTFSWDEKQQGTILGAFFWSHWITQIPGGLLAAKYGTKVVFGVSNFTGVLICFFIPIAARMGYTYLVMLRLLQGLLTGFAWPAMHLMVAKWIPPNERSKFVTSYLGSSVGAAMTFPMCGFIIDRWGWEYAFHACGILGTLWFMCWWFLAYDSPSQHPRITESEKKYIESCIAGTVAAKKAAPVPWGKMLRSMPLWMNVLAQFGGVYGLFMVMTHAPTYFRIIHGWNMKATGVLSGLPHMMRMLFALVCSTLGDYLLKSNRIGKTLLRKIATSLCTIGQGLCMLALAYSGCNSTAAIIFLTMTTAINGSVSTGPLASLVDIAPNYASISLGIVNTVAAVTGFLTPIVVGYLTFQNQTVEQWQKAFWVATVILLASGLLYVFLSSSEIQSWNNPEKVVEKDEEAVMLEENNGYIKPELSEKIPKDTLKDEIC